MNLYPEYQYGDYLKINCELRKPEPIEDFAYDRYLARFDVYSLCYYPQKIFARENSGSATYKKLLELKNIVRAELKAGLKEPSAGLAAATLLGDRQAMPLDIKNAFSRTGLSHIIAISGLHISIISALMFSLLLALGLDRNKCFYLSTILLALYLIIIGLPASALRSGIMGFLLLLAMKTGRLNKPMNSLAAAAAIMLLLNPRLLRDDLGFDLSFASMLGLALYYPAIREWLRNSCKLKKAWLAEPLALTLAAQIFTWPLVAQSFGVVSLVAPLANLAVLWTFPLILSGLGFGLVLSFILPAWSSAFFLPAYGLIAYLVATAQFFASWPHSFLELKAGRGFVLSYYSAIIILNVIIKNRNKQMGIKSERSYWSDVRAET